MLKKKSLRWASIKIKVDLCLKCSCNCPDVELLVKRVHQFISRWDKVVTVTTSGRFPCEILFIQSCLVLVSHQFEPLHTTSLSAQTAASAAVKPPKRRVQTDGRAVSKKITLNPQRLALSSSLVPEPVAVSHDPRGVFVNKRSAWERRLNEEKCRVSFAAKVNCK